MKDGKTFEEALRTRTFEPDVPNFPASPVVDERQRNLYQLSILKSNTATRTPAAFFL